MKMNAKKVNKTKKNNKMNTTIKNNTNTDVDTPFLTPPRIDTIAIVVDMPDTKLHGLAVSEILHNLTNGEFKALKNKIQGYPIAANIPCPDIDGVIGSEGVFVCIMATYKDAEKCQIRIKFSPEKLLAPIKNLHPTTKKEPAIDHLDFVFSGLFGMSFFEFLSHGRVTSLDAFRQICQRSPEDYMFKVKYAQTSQSLFGNDGKLETLYFGKRASNQVVIYDKAREQLGKKAKHELTRVEYRLKPKNMRVHDLWSISNPFAKIAAYSLKCNAPPFGTAHWVAFRDSCRFRGIAKALAQQPKSYRHKLKKAVSSTPVSWWYMSDDEWFFYWHAALQDCSFDCIPDLNDAPPLTMAAAVGMAA